MKHVGCHTARISNILHGKIFDEKSFPTRVMKDQRNGWNEPHFQNLDKVGFAVDDNNIQKKLKNMVGITY